MSDETPSASPEALLEQVTDHGLASPSESRHRGDAAEVWADYGAGLTSSELLEQFCAPMLQELDATDTHEDLETLVIVGARIWNTLVESDSVEAAREAFSALLPEWSDHHERELLPIFDGLAERKAELFPDDHRVFVDVEVTGEPGDAHLDVVAALPADYGEED